MITFQDIRDKIKNKDFTISYKDAIDLGIIMDGGVSYCWVEKVGSTESELLYIDLSLFNVKLHIREQK